MDMPFTTTEFFQVFQRYNEGIWPIQVVLNLLGIAAIGLLFSRRQSAGRWIAAILAFLWVWMAIVYHFLFFTAINSAAWLFGTLFLLGALWTFWLGVIKGEAHFKVSFGLRGMTASILVIFALFIYPALGYLLGHHYPSVPTFGLPCPTTIFTLGILLFAVAPIPRSLFLVPLLWSAIGSIAVFKLGVFQDLGLLVAGLVGLAAVILIPKSTDDM